jgi:hypothetical protein
MHESLRPLGRIIGKKKALLESLLATGELLGSGGFAVVFALSSFTVLKLTCCSQTIKLLDGLASLNKAAHPQGLPCVFERWGPAAVDNDDIEFQAYVLERLFRPEDVSGQSKAKRNGEVQLNARKKYTSDPFQQKERGFRDVNIRLAAAENRCLLGKRTVSAEYLSMAEQLSVSRLPNGLEETFAYLSKFLSKTEANLDLYQTSNIMVDMHGFPVLADPIAEHTREPTLNPVEGSRAKYALVVNTVASVENAIATITWDTEEISDDEEFLKDRLNIILKSASPTVEAIVLPNMGKKHTELLSQASEYRRIWHLAPSTLAKALGREFV